MNIPERKTILKELNRLEIPVVLIGAQALRVHGSSRESYGMDFALRIIDSDAVIGFMYLINYQLPARIAPETEEVTWAETPEEAQTVVNDDKRGSLNFYFLDEEGYPIDQIFFLTDISMPFMRLKQHALLIEEDPNLYCASIADLIIMKKNRIDMGYGSEADKVDLEFLEKKKNDQ